MLVSLEGEQGPEYWVGFKNFYVITRYNRSPLYAMAVFELSEAILAGFEDRAAERRLEIESFEPQTLVIEMDSGSDLVFLNSPAAVEPFLQGDLSVAVGDEVIYGKYGGSDIEINGEEVKILRESDILAKVIK